MLSFGTHSFAKAKKRLFEEEIGGERRGNRQNDVLWECIDPCAGRFVKKKLLPNVERVRKDAYEGQRPPVEDSSDRGIGNVDAAVNQDRKGKVDDCAAQDDVDQYSPGIDSGRRRAPRRRSRPAGLEQPQIPVFRFSVPFSPGRRPAGGEAVGHRGNISRSCMGVPIRRARLTMRATMARAMTPQAAQLALRGRRAAKAEGRAGRTVPQLRATRGEQSARLARGGS